MRPNTRIFAGWTVRLAVTLMLLGGALGLTPRPVLAVPANQKVWTFTQPDGTKFQAILTGDEFYAWHQTPDGSIILQDPKSGAWHYAIPQANGSLKATTMAVGTTAVKTTTLNKDLVPWLKSVEKLADTRAQAMTANFLKGGKVPPTGSVKGVILLANFSDTTATFSAAIFNGLMNTPGYSANGALGSVRDYYLEASYGQLTLQTDVYGWFTLPQPKAYYGGNDSSGNDTNPRQMILDTINASDATVNYANYDADNDGKVDFFGVIHQGQGEEQGGASADCIWSHRWNLSSAKTVDGKTIQDYHTEPELFYSSLTTIGVICHETGHFFGLPDLYDTTYSSEGMGDWSIMASGSWCGPGYNGAKPCHFDPWCKWKLNWITPTPVTSVQNAAPLPAWDKNPTALMLPIDPYQDGEYILVCNRYQRAGTAGNGFDQYLPGSGALVLHIDDDVAGNDNIARKQVDVEEADGLAELDNGLNRGNAGDLYPNGGTAFNDTSNPNSKDNAGASTGIALSNFTGGGSANMTVNITPGPALSGTAIIYDANSNSLALGYGDGDDYACVRFTSATGGTLKRIKPYFVYSGTTNYAISVYSGWSGSAPTGLLTTQSGTHTGVGFEEIVLATPQPIAAGSDFYVKVRFNTSGGTGWPLPVGEDVHPDGRSYVSGSGASFTNLTATSYGSYDLDIRADLTPPAPAVSSITRVNASPTAADTVAFFVAFSQAVNGGAASNFALTTTGGITGAAVAGVNGSGATRTVTVNTGSGNGTIRLDLANTTGLTDAYGQAASGAPYTGGEVYDINHDLPHVTGITLAGSSPTNSAAVTFNVSFSSPVTGVDVTDFALLTSGVSGATISGVSGSGNAWTVMVNTGSGNGTIRLDLVDDDSIKDAGNVPLGGPGTENGDYTAGQIYTIDRTAPTVAIGSAAPNPARTSPIPVTVTFSKAVTGFTGGDLAVVNGGVNNFTGSGTDYTFDLVPAGQGEVKVNIVGGAAQDQVGNPSSAAAQFSRTYDSVAPALTALTPGRGAVISSLASVQLTFGEVVSGVTAGVLKVNGSAATGLAGSGAGPYTFSGFAAPADGTVNMVLAAGAIKDAAGNAFAGDAWTLTKDAALPTVVLTSADVAKTGAINHAPAFTATFSRNVSGFVAGDITVANGTASELSGSGKTYSFKVNPTANGFTTVTVHAGVATDASAPFNPNAASTPYAFTYDTVAPQSQVTAPANNAALTSSTFTLTWSSSDAGGSGVTNVILVWAKNSLSTATVAGSPFAPATTSVKFTGPGSGQYSFYSIATDQAGNVEVPPAFDVRFRVLPRSTALPGWRYYW